ncbi:MAG: translocation/assembly module TamB domain-containing protein [Candidatus Limisoma sp.]
MTTEATNKQDESKPKRKAVSGVRRALRITGIVVVLIAMLPTLLYVPAIFRFVLASVIERVEAATSMKIDVDDARLGFPLTLEIAGLTVAENGDTLATASNAEVEARILPLLMGDVVVRHLEGKGIQLSTTTADSITSLQAKVDDVRLDDVKLKLISGQIEAKSLSVGGGDVALGIDRRHAPKEVQEEEKTESKDSWTIDVAKIDISDVHYKMAMMPTIDSLDVVLPRARIDKVALNLAVGKVSVGSINIDSLSADYVYPTPEEATAFARLCPADTVETTDGMEWTIVADTLRLNSASALYRMHTSHPREGLCMDYIKAERINIAVDDFYNRGATIRIPIVDISARERSGLELYSLNGLVEMSDTTLNVNNIHLETLSSHLNLDAHMQDFDDWTVDVALGASVSLEEVGKAMPDLRPMLQAVSRTTPAELTLKASGDSRKIDINELALSIDKIAKLRTTGSVSNPTDSRKLAAELNLRGELTGGDVVARRLGVLPSSLRIPRVSLAADARYAASMLSAKLRGTADGGKIVADGSWNMRADKTNADIRLAGFDVRSIMPSGNVGAVSGSLTADVKGFDLYTMNGQMSCHVDSIAVADQTLHDISAEALIADGNVELMAYSMCPGMAFDLSLTGSIAPDVYNVSLESNLNDIDLMMLGLTPTPFGGRLAVTADLFADVREERYSGKTDFTDVRLNMGSDSYEIDQLNINFDSSPEATDIALRNGDLDLNFASASGLMAWLDAFGGCVQTLTQAIDNRSIDVAAFKNSMPQFNLKGTAGQSNIMAQYLKASGMEYSRFVLDMAKRDEITFDADAFGVTSGGVTVDSVCLSGYTRNDSLFWDIRTSNSFDNTKLFKYANMSGSISGNRCTAYLSQENGLGIDGFSVGASVTMEDSLMRLSLYPENPTIAAKQWTINPDNFVEMDLSNKSIRANLQASTADGSRISITDRKDSKHNGVNIDMAGIRIKDWLSLSPFAPEVDGTINANMQLSYNDKYIWGNGKIGIDELHRGKYRIGDIGIDARAGYFEESGNIAARIGLSIDDQNVGTIRGVMLDSLNTTYYKMKLDAQRMPLAVANAFFPQNTLALTGYLDSRITFDGTFDNPQLGGYMQLDSATVAFKSYGVKFALDTVAIPFDNGVLRFDRFDLQGADGNPLTIDGYVNLLPFNKMYTDLNISGRNVQLIDGKKTGTSEVFGKCFADIDASLQGYVNRLNANLYMTILSASNVTYLMQTDIKSLAESASSNVVTFVRFADDGKTAAADTIVEQPFAMRINATVTLQPNAQFAVYLSPDGKDRVQINGTGTLNYYQTYQGDSRMTGRYVLSDGMARYNVPMIGEKKFDFVDGSDVSWTGDMLNPQLNIKAVNTVKANITSNESSRMVPFDITLKVDGSLKTLGITFDVTTESDMTVANELSGMTAEQRSQQAMNLLLYGSYSGESTKTASNLSAENLAYSFLQKSLNNWISNNVPGVDFSLGVDRYDTANGDDKSTETSWSYSVSKSFNDRFVISVGGNYSTGESAQDNLEQNLFQDVSFEYKLNKSGTTAFKLYRKTEYESILEGEITEMGGGFVWKRNISSIRDIFRIFKRRKQPVSDRQTVTLDSINTTK